MGAIIPSVRGIWPQGTIISILGILQHRTAFCVQWKTSQSREDCLVFSKSNSAANLHSLSVDGSGEAEKLVRDMSCALIHCHI